MATKSFAGTKAYVKIIRSLAAKAASFPYRHIEFVQKRVYSLRNMHLLLLQNVASPQQLVVFVPTLEILWAHCLDIFVIYIFALVLTGEIGDAALILALNNILYPKAAIFLIKHGASVNATDSLGNSALILALKNGDSRNNSHRNLIEYLIEKGANVNATDSMGNSTLMIAAAKGN